MAKYLFIDGNSVLYRAYYATIKMQSKNVDDFPIGCLNLVIGTLEKFLQKYNPDYLFVVFDAGKETFRHSQYADYKKTRPPMPNDLYLQSEAFVKYLELRKFPILKLKKYEADDIIGTLQQDILKNDSHSEISIITSDQDMLQLVNAKTKVLRITKGFSNLEEYNYENFGNKFYGILPQEIILYKAIYGDSSDNIAGIKGLGAKTALTLIQKFHTLDEIYANLDKLNEKHKNILNDKYNELSALQKLVTIHKEVPLKYEMSEHKVALTISEKQYKKVKKFLDEYHLARLAKNFEENYENMKEIYVIDMGSKLLKCDHYLINQHQKQLLNHYFINWEIINHLSLNNQISDAGIELIKTNLQKLIDDCNLSDGTKIVLAFASEFLRACTNKDDVQKIMENELKYKIEILTKSEECELNYIAFKDFVISLNKPCLIADIGGGSIELIRINYDGNKTFSQSLEIGALNIHKKFQNMDYKEIYEYYSAQIKSMNLPETSILLSGSGSMHAVLNVIKWFEDKNIKNSNWFTAAKLKSTLNKILHLNPDELLKIETLPQNYYQIIKYIFIFLNAIIDNIKIKKIAPCSLNIRIGYLIKKGY